VPTIGVAIAIPEPWASELQDYRTSVGDTTATQIPTHITLVPPTEVPDPDLEAVCAHLTEAASAVSPFDIHLRGTGTFRPVSPVVFVTLAEGISQCEQLAAEVRQGPLEIELEHPYHPHVTVAHHLPEDQLEQAFTDLEDFDATFEVHEMWMYLHDDVLGWQPTRAFPLGV
jgi:2'-5' RNA ligase